MDNNLADLPIKGVGFFVPGDLEKEGVLGRGSGSGAVSGAVRSLPG